MSSTCRHICRLRLTTALRQYVHHIRNAETTHVHVHVLKRTQHLSSIPLPLARAQESRGHCQQSNPAGCRPGFLAAEMPECTRAWAYAHIAKSRAGCTSIHHGHGRKSTRASSGRIPPVTRQGPRARAARFPRAAVAAEGSLKSWPQPAKHPRNRKYR